MFHNDGAFRRVTWRRVLIIMTSQTRLDMHQCELYKSYVLDNRYKIDLNLAFKITTDISNDNAYKTQSHFVI